MGGNHNGEQEDGWKLKALVLHVKAPHKFEIAKGERTNGPHFRQAEPSCTIANRSDH